MPIIYWFAKAGRHIYIFSHGWDPSFYIKPPLPTTSSTLCPLRNFDLGLFIMALEAEMTGATSNEQVK